MKCGSHATTGGQCQHDDGHPGPHQGTYYPGDAAPRPYTWDDADGHTLIEAEARKPQGT